MNTNTTTTEQAELREFTVAVVHTLVRNWKRALLNSKRYDQTKPAGYWTLVLRTIDSQEWHMKRAGECATWGEAIEYLEAQLADAYTTTDTENIAGLHRALAAFSTHTALTHPTHR